MLPLIVAAVATYHYLWRFFTRVDYATKETQTEIPWLFYSELLSVDDIMNLGTDTDESCDSLLFDLEVI